MNKQPTQVDRIVAHAIVGAAVTAVVGKQAGLLAGVLVAALAVIAHEVADAPVAQLVAAIGLG